MHTEESQPLQAQEQLVAQLDAEGWDLMIGAAFVRGMRDIGYKSTAFAMAELIDNSIQASANTVDIVFGFQRGSKPSQIAIIDDGHGMTPKMVRASLIWGAGTRSENRDGFGKYGYGLPTASISQAYRVTVYSKIAGGDWYRGYLDVEEIRDGGWTEGNRIQTPTEKLEEPPKFVIEHLMKAKRWDKLDHGTVVVWDRLDPNRVDYKRREDLRNKLVTDLGVIYRNYLRDTPVTVDGFAVEPCDPLFLTEGFRYHEVDGDRAIPLPPATVEVKDKETGAVVGNMRVRFARMPATFFRQADFKRTNKPGSKNMNERHEIADANHGIIFLRNGRQIDVIRPPRKLASFNATTDRYWGVEVDFDASLDDLFSITTSKQQVTPDARVWDMLKDKAKLFEAIGEMRGVYKKEAAVIRTEVEKSKETQRASVEAIEAAGRFRTTKPPTDTDERRQEAKTNLDRQAKQRAGKAGLKPEIVQRELLAARDGVDHAVESEEMPGAPFFRCVQEGGTRILYLNVAHPFYTEVYAGPGTSPRLRAGLEVLLWTLGNAEVDADPDSDRRLFYERERSSVWTPGLDDALKALKTIAVIETEAEESEDDAETVAAAA
jgi:Histidine kinase-, DNA gyrase B-, and HSP90-like ATPase